MDKTFGHAIIDFLLDVLDNGCKAEYGTFKKGKGLDIYKAKEEMINKSRYYSAVKNQSLSIKVKRTARIRGD